MARYSKEAVEAAIFSSCTTIGIVNWKEKQKEVITYFVEGNDVLAILPTGYGNSLAKPTAHIRATPYYSGEYSTLHLGQ